MKKEVTIGFRTEKAIRDALEEMATEERRSVSAIIEGILYRRIRDMKVRQDAEQERRRYTRKQVSLPAFVMESNSEKKIFHATKVVDISLGGIRLSIPQGLNLAVCNDKETNELNIVFTLPESTKPINVKVKAQSVCEAGDGIQLGAAFIDSDFNSYQALQQHLI